MKSLRNRLRGDKPDDTTPVKRKQRNRSLRKARSKGAGDGAGRADSKVAAPTSPAAPVAPGVPRTIGAADPVLTATIVALVFFGVVMVYSASGVFANRMTGNGYHYLIRQGAYAVAGMIAMVALAKIDYHRYQHSLVTYPILMGVLGLLFVVAFGGGRTVGGAARWIDLKVFRVQPAELAKLAIIFYLSYSLAKKRDKIRDFKVGFLPHVLVSGLVMILCLKQPDFGSAVMIGLLTMVLLFTAGTRANYILGSVGVALPLVYLLVTNSNYRMRRIEAFLNPFADRGGIGYQLAEALVSFGSGGVTGVGLGDSRQKLFYLPEAHTDFISAIVAEELGLIGVLFLLTGFCIVVYRGFRAAWNAVDEYGTYLAVGVTLFVGLQAFTNLSVAMGLLPTKGLTLPFISYGGSSLLVNCVAVGLLLNVSRPREVLAAPLMANTRQDVGPTATTKQTDKTSKYSAGRGAKRKTA